MKIEFKKSRNKFLLVFSSVIFIVALLFVSQINYKGKVSRENRYLATFPKIDNGSDVTKFPKGFEDWLNDRFGFRNKLISRYNVFIFYAFNEITTQKFYDDNNNMLVGFSDDSKAILGTDGHLFFPGTYSIFSEVLPVNTGSMDVLIDKIEAKGRKALIAEIPVKQLFDYDFLPKYVKLQAEQGYRKLPYQLGINDNLSENNKGKYIFPFYEMLELQKIAPVYPSANFHQVEKSPATALFASIVAEKFGVGKFEYPNYDEFTTLCEKKSDFAAAMIGVNFSNKPFYCSSINYSKYGVVNKTEPHVWMLYNGTYVNNMEYSNDLKKGKLLVVGNSFSVPVLPDLAKHFGKVIRLHNDDIINHREKAEKLIKDFNPDYVLFIFPDLNNADIIADALE